jgi:hypothetical protein
MTAPDPEATATVPAEAATETLQPVPDGNPPGSGYFSGVGEGNVTWHPGEYAPGTFQGASLTGQPPEPPPPMEPPGPCRCDEHKYGHRPGADAVLYSGPDAVLLLINGAIRDGRYEDVHAYADAVTHSVHADLDAAERRIRRTLAPAVQAWQRLYETVTAVAA